MNMYEKKVLAEAEHWQHKMLKRSSMLQRTAKNMQIKLNSKIPDKVHLIITESIKKMVEATLVGSNLTTKQRDVSPLSFEEKEKQVLKAVQYYRKAAAVEGAGTGAGGLLLGAADFPLLLSIKMKCLFEIASIYGCNIKSREERIYILYIFHLAFCGESRREAVFHILENWNTEEKTGHEINWQTFQQEYRDYIDLVKMFQLIPGLGAVVGAFSNHHLVDHLGETAMNVYRLRFLQQ